MYVFNFHLNVRYVRYVRYFFLPIFLNGRSDNTNFRLGSPNFCLDSPKFFKLNEEFQSTSSSNTKLLLRKGVFPYDWFDDWSKLEMKNLPERDDFYNSLKEADCSLADFNHADNVWTAFKCKTFRDYMEHYLKCTCLIFIRMLDMLDMLDIFSYKFS